MPPVTPPSSPPSEAPARVLFLSSCVRGGGPGFSLYYLLKHLDRSRVEPLVVLPNLGVFAERFAELGVRAVVAPRFPERTAEQRFKTDTRVTRALSYAQNVVDSVRLVPWLAEFIRREQVSLVYCNNMMVKPIGAPAAELAGVPCVLHARNLHEKALPIALYCRLTAQLPSVKRVIANSAATAVPYQRFVPNKVSVVHNGVDLADYRRAPGERAALRERLGLPRDAVVIGFSGYLTPRKGVDVLIRAAAQITSTRPQLHFAIAGRVPIDAASNHRAEYEALARELGIADRVHFLGFVEDVPRFVAGVDALALPSFQEPFGRAIIEAMALGTPVVGSDVGGIPEIIQHEESGLLAPPGDADALARALARLADDPELRERLGKAAERTVRERFDVVALTRTLENLLVEAARAKRPA